MKRNFLLLSIILSLLVPCSANAKTTVEGLLDYEPEVNEITVDYSDKSIEINDKVSTLQKELDISETSSTPQIKRALNSAGYTEVDKEGFEITYRSRFENKRLIVKGSPKSDNIDKASFCGWTIFQYESVGDTISAYNELKRQGYQVFPDEPIVIEANTWKDSSLVENGGAVEMGLDKMQSIGTNNVTVAVIDTGFSYSEYFKDRVYDAINLSTESSCEDTWNDGSGHGTGVASVIVDSTGNYVKVLPIKVTGADGTGVETSIVAAFEHIFENKDADVINLCLGWQCSSSDSAASKTFWNDVIDKAINEYHIPVVVAAGNKGTKDTCYPANLDDVWSVSCLGELVNSSVDYGVISSFSNFGNIDFCARGYDVPVINANGVKTTDSGTSVAAPLISALTANLMTKYNYTTCDVLYGVIKDICTDLGDTGYDEYYGWGLPIYTDGSGNPCPNGCNFIEKSRKESTCTSEGEIISYCSRCGNKHTDTIAIDPSKHTGYSFSFTDATCTEPSYKVKKCKGCKVEISRTVYSEALGHHVDSELDVEEDIGDVVVTYHVCHCDRCGQTTKTEVSRKAKEKSSVSTQASSQNQPGIVEKTTQVEIPLDATTEKTTEVTIEKSKEKEASIYPKSTKIISLKKKSRKKLTIICQSQNDVIYIYQYSTSKKFKKTTTKKSKENKITVSIKKKTYYVRVRTSKVVEGKMVLSPWSKVKKVKK